MQKDIVRSKSIYLFQHIFTPIGQFSFKGIKNMHKLAKIFTEIKNNVKKNFLSFSIYKSQRKKVLIRFILKSVVGQQQFVLKNNFRAKL